MTDNRKTMHINLYDDQIDDYQVVREATGITNDNDLVRHLLREKARALRAETRLLERTLIDTPEPYRTEAIRE